MTQENQNNIISLYKKGIDILSIRKRTGTKFSEIKKVIEEYAKEKKFFNVHEFDCWIMPTKP